MKTRRLLIIGAGPYGLAAAAYAKHRGVDLIILGKPMEFWEAHMPQGMLLRTGVDWHMDPLNTHTFEAFLAERGISKAEVSPVVVELFREYGRWFANQSGLSVLPSRVKDIRHQQGLFEVILDDGSRLLAENVLAAPGFRPFLYVPEEVAALIPGRRYAHTCELVNFEHLRGKRCLIIGGRQSAFEWAALMHESGAEEVHLAYRHDTPRFVKSDWTWVEPLSKRTLQEKGWFRRLPAEERTAIERRFWEEGRLRLEPWLAPRINKPQIKLWPNCTLHACQESDGGALAVSLSNGQVVTVDTILFATGYKVNTAQVPYLSGVLPALETSEGFPALDEDFQTSIPGLFVAGLMATKAFGPFYAFVKSCPTAARIIVDKITHTDALRP